MDKIQELSLADLKKIYNLLEVNGHSKEWFIEQLRKYFETHEENVEEVEAPVRASQNLSAKERKKIANRKAYLKRKAKE